VVLAKSGRTEEARAQLNRAVLLARAAEPPSQTIEALLRAASGCLDAGFAAESLKLLEELQKLVVQPESEVDAAAELVNVAELLDDLGQKDKALAVLGEAMRLARSLPDPWFRLERLLEIADTYATSGAGELALPLLAEAEDLCSKIEEYSRPYFLLRLAEVYIELKRQSEAAAVLDGITPIVLKNETAYEKAGGLVEIAQKYLEIEEKAAALDLLHQAARLIEKITNTREQINLQIELAEWLDEAGGQTEAAALAEQACGACSSLAARKASLFCLGSLAVLYVYLNDIERASRTVEQIVSIVKDTSAKTAGLGAVGLELASEEQTDLALKLAEVIREPELLVNLYVAVAEYGRKKG